MKVPGLEQSNFDGIAEVWFSDLPSALGLSEDPDYLNGAALDDPNFIDINHVTVVYAEEVVPGAGAEIPGGGAVKVLEFIRRSAEASTEEFADRWPSLAQAAATRLKAEHQVVTLSVANSIGGSSPSQSDPRFASGLEETFSGVNEMWWADAAAFREAVEDADAWSEARPSRLVDQRASVGMSAADTRVT
jgi:hypothetical protein